MCEIDYAKIIEVETRVKAKAPHKIYDDLGRLRAFRGSLCAFPVSGVYAYLFKIINELMRNISIE